MNFLDISFTSITDDKYEFNVHHEDAITNIHCIRYRILTYFPGMVDLRKYAVPA